MAAGFAPVRAQETPTTQSAEQTLPQPDPQATFSTRITPGTEIYVAVTDEPDVSGTKAVDADGSIGFSIADRDGKNQTEWRVTIKDKTVGEAKDAVVESLKTYYKSPEVRVIITKLPRLKVEISGAVQKPGTLELKPGSLLSDALAAAIYKPNADLSKVRITHKGKEGESAPPPLLVDYAGYIEGRNELDPELKSGDRIVLIALPQEAVRSAPQFVRIVGEVVHDAYVPYANGMRVKSALDQAGGLKSTADRSKLRLVRSDGKILELDADKVEADDPVHNLFLSPNDMLFVNVRDQSLIYSVMGEVLKPNTFPFPADSKVSLLQAIEQAGGLTKTADKRKGILRRGFLRNPAAAPELPFDIEQIIKSKQPNWELEPGDAIIILPRQKRPTFWQQAMPFLFRFLPFGI